MRGLARILAAVVSLVFLPAASFAQASITGTVKDTSGAVLPGVTVEAASPALLERVRTVTTDGSGQYRIVELRPGAYVVTFSLPGFNTVRRDGIELTGSNTSLVTAELRVGALEETVTVTGEAPIVDVQNTMRQKVMDQEVISTLPTQRNSFALGVLIPGVSMTGASQDVGGAVGPETQALVTHGGRTADQRLTMNGVSLSTMVAGGWGGGAIPSATSVQEITIDTSAVSADLATGGVRINFIPKEGGNVFSGSMFGSFANDAMQTSNYTDRVRQLGLTAPGNVEKNWDFNPGVGGPIKRDKLWFYASARSQGAYIFAPGMYYNKNAGDATKWTYEPDLSRPASNKRTWTDGQLRLSWQASAKNKIGFLFDSQTNCLCHDAISATRAPEASQDRRFPLQRYETLDWTSPITNKILIEASAVHRVERWGNMHLQTRDESLAPNTIGVLEQAGAIPNLVYRAYNNTFNNSWNTNLHYRGSVSYISGAHALKVGFNDAIGYADNETYTSAPYAYRFSNGVPNQVTLFATPYVQQFHVDHDLGAFIQDKWTVGRLTATGGLRYDRFANSFPAQTLGPSPLTPTRNLSFPETKNLRWNDITPKSGVSYDLFGTGKTALKVALNKYLAGYGTTFSGLASNPNPIAVLSTTANRAWTDGNRNFVPDCDLLNPALQDNLAGGGDLCGVFNDATFGKPIVTNTFDPALTTGWGKRDFNWEFSTGVQHELLPRVSVDVSFFRRWYGNFQVNDNRAVTAADYDAFSITVPNDPRLPNPGATIDGFKNLSAVKFGQSDVLTTLAKNYGKQIEHWNGVDISANARLRGLTVQGGTSTGRTSTDNCEILEQLPEVSASGLPYCHVDTRFLTQVKGFAAYLVPKVAVQLSAAFQSQAGPQITANWAAPNSAIQPSLGRPLSGNAANQTVNLVAPGTLYGERLNQLDVRIAKPVRVGRTRTSLNLDLYNLLNNDTILSLSSTYVPLAGGGSTWQLPTALLQARFIKVSAQFDF